MPFVWQGITRDITELVWQGITRDITELVWQARDTGNNCALGVAVTRGITDDPWCGRE